MFKEKKITEKFQIAITSLPDKEKVETIVDLSVKTINF